MRNYVDVDAGHRGVLGAETSILDARGEGMGARE